MNELIEPALSIIITILAATTAFFAIKTLIKLTQKKKTRITRDLTKIIALVAAGYLLWTTAEITWTITEALNLKTIPKIADALWLLGYPFLILSFSLLAFNLFNKEGQKTRITGMLSTLAILATFAITLINQNCPATQARCIDYIYSVLSITIFIIITSINTFLEEIPLLSTPFTLIGISFFVDFMADITYAVTSPIIYTTPTAIADGLYTLSYIMTTIAFYKLSKKRTK